MIKSGVMFKIIFLIMLLAGIVILSIGLREEINVSAKQAAGRSFFEQFVMAGGPVVWFILIPMSFVMVYLTSDYSLTIRRSKLLPKDVVKDVTYMFINSGTAGIEKGLSEKRDFASAAISRAVKEGRGDWFRMRSVVAESLQEQAGKLFRRIEWINLLGTVSPMVGLFGTVFGMIKLFNSIVMAGGQPQPGDLADGISIALVTTLWGLFIAIPSTAVYGIFSNRIETLTGDAVVEAEKIMDQVRQALKRKQLLRKQIKQKVPIVDYKDDISKPGSQPQRRPIDID